MMEAGHLSILALSLSSRGAEHLRRTRPGVPNTSIRALKEVESTSFNAVRSTFFPQLHWEFCAIYLHSSCNRPVDRDRCIGHPCTRHLQCCRRLVGWYTTMLRAALTAGVSVQRRVWCHLKSWVWRHVEWRHGQSKPIWVFGAVQTETHLSKCDLKLPPEGGFDLVSKNRISCDLWLFRLQKSHPVPIWMG